MPKYPRSTKRREATAAGFASGFEHTIYKQLQEAGVKEESIGYEEETFSLDLPVHRGYSCESCGETKRIFKASRYTPDFFLGDKSERAFIVETKGRFTALDRKKALAITTQYPDLDYRMLFEYDNALSKGSKTRYSTWCERQGITYAVKRIPEEWIAEISK